MEEKIDGISILLTCDDNRLDFFKKTLERYAELGLHNTKYEVLCASRTLKSFVHSGIKVKVLPYTFNHTYFDPAVGLNIALHLAKYPSVIVTCPGIYPLTDVFSQLRELPIGNYGCKVFDETSTGDRSPVLISTTYRNNLPGTAFLGLYNKEDLIKINGWDLKFMRGHSWSDTSFSTCWNNQGLSWKIIDDIQVVHLYHVRNGNNEGYAINRLLHEETEAKGLLRAETGYEETAKMYFDEGKRDFSEYSKAQ